MELLLKRELYDDVCTQGVMMSSIAPWVPRYHAFTIERPRNDRMHPCIPAGRYQVVRYVSPHWSQEYGRPFVVPLLADVPDRTAIEIHIANWADQLEGCIAVGDSRGYLEEVMAVVNSKPAFERLMDLLEPAWAAGEETWLTIVDSSAPNTPPATLPVA